MAWQAATQALATVLPLFLLAATGVLCARWVETEPLNRVNLAIFLPALVFVSLAGIGDSGGLAWIALFGALIVLGSGVIARIVCAFAKWDWRETVPPMMFSNYGNMGLPLITLAFGQDALPVAVTLFMAGNVLHVTVGFKIMGGSWHWKNFFGNPIFVAAMLGLAVNFFDIEIAKLAPPVWTALEMAAAASIPLMLLALGGRMRSVDMATLRQSAGPGLLCPVSGLLCYAVLVWFFPLSLEDKLAVLLFAALPPALLNYMFAEQFKMDATRIASIVMTGNLLAVVVLPLVLTFAFYWQGG